MLKKICRLIYYPEYERQSFQRKYLNLWRPSVEILSRMCQSNRYRKNQRWRANVTILMSGILYQYTCLLLMNSQETSKCNWNEFRSKEISYMIPKCIIVISKLSIIVMLRKWDRNNRKTFMFWFPNAYSFVKACFIFLSCVFSDGNYNSPVELAQKRP